jgi:osmotically inducible protein OsmC
MATRDGRAHWNGALRDGFGTLTIGNDLWTTPYTFRNRFTGVYDDVEDADEAAPMTNPEEVLASAHAACFSMALSLVLTERGTPPTSIDTLARVHLRNVEGWATIQEIDLQTTGVVPGLDAAEFEKCAEMAKTGCIISRALASVDAINLRAELRA